ncbi:hypothetical protein C8R45DRAFT_947404 [Mycena sanguinolenta]|nr:hypothetical protein C8R45DRAFT_947404 [Mycena sanguinolenta]
MAQQWEFLSIVPGTFSVASFVNAASGGPIKFISYDISNPSPLFMQAIGNTSNGILFAVNCVSSTTATLTDSVTGLALTAWQTENGSVPSPVIFETLTGRLQQIRQIPKGKFCGESGLEPESTVWVQGIQRTASGQYVIQKEINASQILRTEAQENEGAKYERIIWYRRQISREIPSTRLLSTGGSRFWRRWDQISQFTWLCAGPLFPYPLKPKKKFSLRLLDFYHLRLAETR